MSTNQLTTAIQYLMSDCQPDGGAMTDEELLARFLNNREGSAISALVQRHAPMVWGVCRRRLNHHEAEDAFQATFLVFVRKAAGVPRQAIGNWLYGVARMTSVRLRATAVKQRQREMQLVSSPEPVVAEGRDIDSQNSLDEVLSHLPDRYRSVLVQCYLEGRTRKETARQLGIPEGSVASRLARAREMLAKRLSRRVAVTSGTLATLLTLEATSTAVPVSVLSSTIRMVSGLAAGQVGAKCLVPAKVAVLTQGVQSAMKMIQLKTALGVMATILAVTTLTVGTMLGGQQNGGEDKSRPESQPPKAVTPGGKPMDEEAKQRVVPAKDDVPKHIVEKPDMKGVGVGFPYKLTLELAREHLVIATKAFIVRTGGTMGNTRFRDYFDPRYLKKHGLTDRDIAFEITDHEMIGGTWVADDLQTVLVGVTLRGGKKEEMILRWVVYEGCLYLSPEKAPDPKTGIFKPWILKRSLP